jgi:hypothetical protein
MSWSVVFCDEFDAEFEAMAESLQDELLAHALLLREFGPNLGRPTVDTLKGSKFPNMKDLAGLSSSHQGGKGRKNGKKT